MKALRARYILPVLHLCFADVTWFSFNGRAHAGNMLDWFQIIDVPWSYVVWTFIWIYESTSTNLIFAIHVVVGTLWWFSLGLFIDRKLRDRKNAATKGSAAGQT